MKCEYELKNPARVMKPGRCVGSRLTFGSVVPVLLGSAVDGGVVLVDERDWAQEEVLVSRRS